MTLSRPALLFVLFPMLLSASMLCRPSGAQDAHTHGVAALTMAIDKGTLEIQFNSPATNLVGFEQRAKSADQKKAVARAETILRDPNRFFVFEGTSCQLQNTTIDLGGVLNTGAEVSDGHDVEHHHGGSNAHHEGGHGEIPESGHSEISAEYRFSCKNAEELVSMAVNLISEFPGIQDINTMWITPTAQGAVSLTSNRSVVFLE